MNHIGAQMDWAKREGTWIWLKGNNFRRRFGRQWKRGEQLCNGLNEIFQY